MGAPLGQVIHSPLGTAIHPGGLSWRLAGLSGSGGPLEKMLRGDRVHLSRHKVLVDGGSQREVANAEEEGVAIVENHAPKRFVVENGKLKGMTFDVMEYDTDAQGRITAGSRIDLRT